MCACQIRVKMAEVAALPQVGSLAAARRITSGTYANVSIIDNKYAF